MLYVAEQGFCQVLHIHNKNATIIALIQTRLGKRHATLDLSWPTKLATCFEKPSR